MGKVLPFAQQFKKKQSNTIVQEDKAPSHAHNNQQEIFLIFDISQLLWPRNLPDPNIIKPAWLYIKEMITLYGLST